MSSNRPADEEASSEISVLIRALHSADERLEELTAGSVDTVTDRSGRSYVMQRAQDQLRYNEAARQADILDALPANIVLLDATGCIVSVNEPWRHLAVMNGYADPQHGIGRNYLTVCDETTGADAPQARAAADGIRSVLNGVCKRFSMEYPCKMPSGHKWFLLTATPLGGATLPGAVVMHVDISAEKSSELALLQFATAMDATADAIYVTDRTTMKLVHFNEAACQMQQESRQQVFVGGPHGALGVSRSSLERVYDEIIASGTAARPEEMLRRRTDGSIYWVEIRCQAIRSAERWVMVTLVRDITHRKQSEQRIVQLNRVHAVLSGINTLIVRVRDRPALFSEACHIAVEAGGFQMAWIGLVDRTVFQVVPVASVGVNEELLTLIEEGLSLQDVSTKQVSPAVHAIREKRLVLVDMPDHPSDPTAADSYARAGIHSLGVFPLLIEDEAVGVFCLYAREKNFFHAAELKLLSELAGDVAFAIDHIEKRDQLEYVDYYDRLTGLANRNLFLDRVTQQLRGAKVSGTRVAMFMVDLERFKNLNDSLGRAAGDALLKQVAAWLSQNVGDNGLLARLSADHFAVFLPAVGSDSDIARTLEAAVSTFIKHAFEWNEHKYRLSAKTGVAVFPEDGSDAETLFRNAEAALKKAKTGSNRYLFYSHKMTDSTSVRVSLENQLRNALDQNQFVLHYQPKVNLTTGSITGAEALIRWNDPHTGLVPPGKFIPILEETGLIFDVGRWAIGQAMHDHLAWRNAGLPSVRVAVNVSALQLANRVFVQEIGGIASTDGLACVGLELEITESLIMQDVRHSIITLQKIRDMGITIAVDDFGTGFSSLSYLARLPINTLKIDRAFVVDMTTGPQGRALVAMIINLAHSLRLKVVAEGVETQEQLAMLREMKCDEMQGYLFSKPISADDFSARFLQ